MMNKQLKKTAIVAIIFAVMVGMIPANIAWAGRLWQTLPTIDPLSTPILIRTTAAAQNTAIVSNQTSTSTFLPGTNAPAASPTLASPVATNSTTVAPPVLPVNTDIVTPGSTSGSIQTTDSTQQPGKGSATLPPGFVPTQSTQTTSDYVPVISSTNPSANEPSDGTSQPITIILFLGIILLIIIGVVLRKLLTGNRKP